ncbi:hypothetical protein KSF_054520 [Reticulibacter mediterranei]|uniref:Uncharacterized protein n=1 Tax=Reticulibacter mediterranei TaxID=2778369 RepID=A0A8J3IPG1_9CHLR|nr:hypothetical protein [Reticulibacter mediterranei]GHO95404.1 hypothetical protein KSF_054520 [Reticulibacter mediterranei]
MEKKHFTLLFHVRYQPHATVEDIAEELMMRRKMLIGAETQPGISLAHVVGKRSLLEWRRAQAHLGNQT